MAAGSRLWHLAPPSAAPDPATRQAPAGVACDVCEGTGWLDPGVLGVVGLNPVGAPALRIPCLVCGGEPVPEIEDDRSRAPVLRLVQGRAA